MSKTKFENNGSSSSAARFTAIWALSIIQRGKARLRKIRLLACAALGWTLVCHAQPQTNCPSLNRGGLLDGFESNFLRPSFDNPSTNIPFSCFSPFRFCGNTYTNLWINQDGNVTLDDPFGGHVPPSFVPALPLTNLQRVIFAPFWADVDTTTNGSGTVGWGCGCVLVNSNNTRRAAFGITWRNVSYYKNHRDKTNSFQMLIIDRSDLGTNFFDLQYRYGTIQWDTADSASGMGGLCNFGAGFPARVGFASGTNGVELPGSGVCNALLDNGRNSLAHSTTNGVFTWRFTNCVPGSRLP